MTTTIDILKGLGLSIALFAHPGAWAADACRPLKVFPADAILQFDRQRLDVAPRLEATLARDLTLTRDPASLGLDTPAAASVLTHAVLVSDEILGLGALSGDKASLSFDTPAVARAIVSHGEQHFLLGIRDGRPVDADGQTLEVAPTLTRKTSFTLPAGTRLTETNVGKVVVAKGSKLVWTLESDPSLAFSLLRTSRLEETSALTPPASLAVIKPSRVPPGANITVQVKASGFDFQSKAVVFCFALTTKDAQTAAVSGGNGKLLSQTGDVATFEIQVPSAIGETLSSGVPAPGGSDLGLVDSMLGPSASVRVIGIDGGKLVLDAASHFTLSNAKIAAAGGVLMLILLFVISGWMMQQRSPLAIIAALVTNPSSGKYSLSNVQVLLWTVLVVFALCYAWFGTGELLSISSGILVLLGISGTTSVLVRTMGKDKNPAVAAVPTEPSLKDIIWSEEEGFDLLRFQMLGFTLFTWCYSLLSVLRSEGLPEIPENLYVLMGISNATYVGGKLSSNGTAASAPPSAPASDALTDFERAVAADEITKMQASLGVTASGQIDAETREAVKKFKLEQGIVPANDRVDRLLLEKVAFERTVPT